MMTDLTILWNPHIVTKACPVSPTLIFLPTFWSRLLLLLLMMMMMMTTTTIGDDNHHHHHHELSCKCKTVKGFFF